MADSDVLQDTMTVTVDGISYTFAIPSIYDEMRIGVRMRDIRRKLDPSGDGTDAGLDGATLYMNRACATFEVMLRSCSDTWPYSEGTKGPTVDSEKFPKERAAAVVAVYQALQEKLMSFRDGGSAARKPPAEQAMAGQ
jgi:hypothetical protein